MNKKCEYESPYLAAKDLFEEILDDPRLVVAMSSDLIMKIEKFLSDVNIQSNPRNIN